MNIEAAPLIGGLAMITVGLRLPRLDLLRRFDNVILRAWGSGRRVDPSSQYARFQLASKSAFFCIFGFFLVLIGLGLA